MKTIITSMKLKEATGAVAALASKDVLSPFGKVRLDVAGRNVSLTGSDGDVQLEVRFEGETTESGVAVLPGAAFARICAALPTGPVEIGRQAEPPTGRRAGSSAIKSEERDEKTTLGGKVVVSAGGGTFKLAAYGRDEFAVMAGTDEKGAVSFRVEATKLREMLRKVRFAASKDTTRKVLCGVNVTVEKSLMMMTATDGRQLATVEAEIGDDTPERAVAATLPNKASGILHSLLDGCDGSGVDIACDGKKIAFFGDGWALTAKLCEDVYPQWRRVVPVKHDYTATIDRELFLAALSRVALAAEENGAVTLTAKDSTLTLAARNAVAEARQEVPLEGVQCREKVKRDFDWRLLKAALEAVDDDVFTMGFDVGASGPVTLKCSVPWLAVVMSMNAK